MSFLYVPFRTAEQLDFGQSLRLLIDQHGFQPSHQFDDDLVRATELRATASSAENEDTNINPDLFLNYIQLLDCVARRFPPDSTDFAWYSTLGHRPQGPFRSRNLAYERTNALFQLGCAYSQQLWAQPRHSADGQAKACVGFQTAAGCFKTVGQNGGGMDSDFDPLTTSFLTELMLAQAQESVWVRAAAAATPSPSVVAKLAVGAANHYGAAHAHGSSARSITQDWLNHVAVKQNHFMAAAHARHAEIAAAQFRYGDVVAHWTQAVEWCQKAAKHKRYVSQFVLDDLAGLTAAASDSLRSAQRENDLVYLAPVPDGNLLPPLPSADMVKVIIPEFPLADFFSKLVPLAVVEAAVAFRLRQQTYVDDTVVVPVQALSRMLHKFLADRNLPAAVDALQQPESVPGSVAAHAKEIAAYGADLLQASVADLGRLAQSCHDIVGGCYVRLEKEAAESAMLAQRYAFSRPSSHEASARVRARVAKMELYLAQAAAGDKTIASDYAAIRPTLEVYYGGYDALAKFIPPAKYQQLEEPVRSTVVKLRELLTQAKELTDQRKQFVANLEIKARDNNILPTLLDKYKRAPDAYHDLDGYVDTAKLEQIYLDHIESVFRDDIGFVESQKNTQIDLEKKIDEAYAVLGQHQLPLSEREAALQKLEHTYSVYLQLLASIKEGVSFYHQLMSNGNDVLQDCENFLNERRLEGRDVEQRS